MADVIEWDDGNRDKCRKHGVSIEEIEELLTSGRLIVFPDPYPEEPRLRGIGTTGPGRHVFLVWTIRENEAERRIRPISARYMHDREVKYYGR